MLQLTAISETQNSPRHDAVHSALLGGAKHSAISAISAISAAFSEAIQEL